MRFKGKKPIFNIKDTWDLNVTLNPIIHEGLVKYKGVTQDCEFAGVPADFSLGNGDIDLQGWLDTIDEMIFAFSGFQVDIDDYNFKFKHLKTKDGGFSIITDNETEYQRYIEDDKAANERKQKGLELFARYYQNLWW